MADVVDRNPPAPLETAPARYKHWRLEVDGAIAKLVMVVDEAKGLRPDYRLKLNSYDFGVDVELCDAIQRVRFEHPGVRTLVVTSGWDRIFCAGANIYMLGSSTHAFKVNFCKYTNETRLSLEDLSRNSGVRTIAALNGTASGGGYELAIACDEIYLVDDGNSAVSLPEVPLLGVLPGTGGLTRLVDKRKIRRDLADVFSTVAEGIKGKRAKEWRLVDDVFSKSTFEAKVAEKAAAAAKASKGPPPGTKGVVLGSVAPKIDGDVFEYEHVRLTLEPATRTATLLFRGPKGEQPTTAEAILAVGENLWALKAFREFDDALLRLRMHHPEIGIVRLLTEGDAKAVLAVDAALAAAKEHWFAREVLLLQARVLRRLDATAKSFFALVEPGSCFAGSLLELALAADRAYGLNDPKKPLALGVSTLNGGAYPMSHGLTRLKARFLYDPSLGDKVLAAASEGVFDGERADELGLFTYFLDDIDYEDDVRVAVEERASLSPDALTGMEASLRFPGPENCDSKIFGRLTAWQNWIFQRPNAVGDKGALTNYGQPVRPTFDWRRT
jgi:benzoyl-CoA-dihydrodiol lyase